MVEINKIHSDELAFSGCCIRLDPGGVYIHHNAAHASLNVQGVSINAKGEVEVKHTSMGPIIAAIASPDETIAGTKGILAGVSGGTGTSNIRLYDTRIDRKLDLKNSSDYKRVANQYSNIWLFWMHYYPKINT